MGIGRSPQRGSPSLPARSFRPMTMDDLYGAQAPSVPKAPEPSADITPGEHLIKLRTPERVDLTFKLDDGSTVTIELDPDCLAAGEYTFKLSCTEEIRQRMQDNGVIEEE